MPRNLNNWSERDVISFLKEHGFAFYETRKGSHYAYINKTSGHIVEINIPKDAYVLRTLETMIRQSGIPKQDWKDWANT
jgi:predicted RNA binding protein YcfA (HicA-like mRNA interferase family)